MATVRKWEGRLIVTGDTTNIPPFHSHRMTLVVTPEEAITLARELRDAADPWSEEACIEWMRSHCALTVRLNGSEMRIIDRPDGLTDLREGVHELAAKRGIPCPLGDICKVCHPPVPPVPSDEELAAMGTEELIEWIDAYDPHSHLKAVTILGLAKKVAKQLREAKHYA